MRLIFRLGVYTPPELWAMPWVYKRIFGWPIHVVIFLGILVCRRMSQIGARMSHMKVRCQLVPAPNHHLVLKSWFLMIIFLIGKIFQVILPVTSFSFFLPLSDATVVVFLHYLGARVPWIPSAVSPTRIEAHSWFISVSPFCRYMWL